MDLVIVICTKLWQFVSVVVVFLMHIAFVQCFVFFGVTGDPVLISEEVETSTVEVTKQHDYRVRIILELGGSSSFKQWVVNLWRKNTG